MSTALAQGYLMDCKLRQLASTASRIIIREAHMKPSKDRLRLPLGPCHARDGISLACSLCSIGWHE